ncbi:MAG: hypothetical protein K6A40_03865 [Solobacterium sp.]|nr:hypothetical protein [Solobacterium sp.]
MKKFNIPTPKVNRDFFTARGKEPLSAILIPLAVTAVIFAAAFYLFLPSLNLHDGEFWFFVISAIILYMVIKGLHMSIHHIRGSVKISFLVLCCLLAAWALLGLWSTKLFHAKAYSQILTVTDDTVESIPSVEATDAIALMDTASAERLGDRRIGSLTDVVSQFNVGEYIQINYRETPSKVAALSYDGFFKWSANRGRGVPGYVIVNPVDMSAEYVALENGMRYVPSAWFNDNLYRRIRFKYPFDMIGNLHFEIDEDGKPWYIASVYQKKIGWFGGLQVKGAIVADPVSGEIAKYNTGEIPVFADVVFDGDLICTQYNNYAQLKHGFWNSIFAQTDCRRVTTLVETDDDESRTYSDYGYIAMDGDIWIYTGVTSVNGDSSNLGFILSNERTEETRYIPCAGADEFSGMRSAEGEVQEKGYTASFPSLINVDGVPTYIMVLKDANGLVKMFAAVNVEQYNQVVTASSQEECLNRYRMMITGKTPSEEEVDPSALKEKTIVVTKMEKIDIEGNTWLYIVDEKKEIYKAKYADVLGMLMVSEGDSITILTDGSTFRMKE